MVDPPGRRSESKSSQARISSHLVSSQLWTWKIVTISMLGDTDRSRVVTSMSPWTYRWNFTVWKRWKSHIQSQNKYWGAQEMGWLPLRVSSPKQGHINTKLQGMPLEISVKRTFQILLGSLKNYLMKVMRRRFPNMSILTDTFIYQYSLRSVW